MDNSSPIFPLRRIIGILLGGLMLIVLVWYVLFQARLLITGPDLVILQEPAVVQTERTITLEGQAHNIAYLTLNGRRIYTDINGYFKEALVLENGYTITTIEAADRYGRTKALSRTFVYVPASLVTR